MSSHPYQGKHDRKHIYALGSLMKMSSLWSWADEQGIDEQALPRDVNALLEVKKLDFLLLFHDINKLIKEISSRNVKETDVAEYITKYTNRLAKTSKTTDTVQDIPYGLGQLVQLEELCISMSPIERLPDDIVYLQNLKKLCLCFNGNLILTDDQKLWIHELEKNGAEVSYDDDLLDRCTWSFWA